MHAAGIYFVYHACRHIVVPLLLCLQKWLVYPSAKLIIQFLILHDYWIADLLCKHTHWKQRTRVKKKDSPSQAKDTARELCILPELNPIPEAARIIKKSCHCPLPGINASRGRRVEKPHSPASPAAGLYIHIPPLSLSRHHCTVGCGAGWHMEETSIGTEGSVIEQVKVLTCCAQEQKWGREMSMEGSFSVYWL